ncbi:MAG: 23S rRNA (uracil(1939)-C(5))-methyltransferase RlmD [Gammaproteobacteria bacterium]|nr:23S rRNA (uracil(1939)-C(5))-methyltransferase RlmD [Gammaproteobacteria bacterium]MCF6229428.1 23S rRNA (uracil(1939)-C(5))-methyltransferase RlmD [Gammaproteobacteria bacterium]
MARRTRRRRFKKVPAGQVTVTIESLSHEGRGVARVDDKVVFVNGALAGEEVVISYVRSASKFDEAQVDEVLTASEDRTEPKCPHFAVCGACSLQHMHSDKQIEAKQAQLLEHFAHIGKVVPEAVLPPLTGPLWGYRRKARLGVRNVHGKGRVLVGFRERYSPYLADMHRCEVLHPDVGERLDELSELIGSLDAHSEIAQIEVAVSDDVTAMVFRNLVALSEGDREKLIAYAKRTGIHLYEQPKGPKTVAALWPVEGELFYRLPEYDIEMKFRPGDFTQVNTDINQKMIPKALMLLDIQPHETVLDLFCGLGNFTLPLARKAKHVVGVEGDEGLVQRAIENARRNGIENVEYHVANLAEDVSQLAWMAQHYDKILIDPARSGALEVLHQLAKFTPEKLVYVSCNPATLARDAGVLVNEHGYRLKSAGVMDMFPHTTHVESIALFERKR